jgi:hypothetical protein
MVRPACEGSQRGSFVWPASARRMGMGLRGLGVGGGQDQEGGTDLRVQDALVQAMQGLGVCASTSNWSIVQNSMVRPAGFRVSGFQTLDPWHPRPVTWNPKPVQRALRFQGFNRAEQRVRVCCMEEGSHIGGSHTNTTAGPGHVWSSVVHRAELHGAAGLRGDMV